MGAVDASLIVDGAFGKAYSYAESAKSGADSFLATLRGAIYTPPTIHASWTSLAAPTLPSMPTAPSLPTVEFNNTATPPSTLALGEPTIDISEMAVADPTLSFPVAPTVSYGTAPTVPSVASVTLPDAPTLAAVTVPTYLSLGTVTVPTIDLHEAWLTNLENIPTLSLLAPTPYSYARGPEYADALLSDLKAKLIERLAGGTGLSPAVEQAIWDRGRDREMKAAQGNIDQILRTSDALGFPLPAGTVAAQTREAEQNYFDKLSELSRDVAVKQAELEQENLKQTITAGMQLEGQLIDYSYKMEQLSFETAKAYASNAIEAYNAQVNNYKALLDGYHTYADAYKTIIDGQMAAVQIYKAQLDGEQTKANINNTLVQQYKAQIEASMAQVEIYKAQLGGAQALIQIEQTKISAAAETIRAYTAQVSAEAAKVEAYKAGVQAEATKVEVYKSQVDAYQAKVGAQAEKSKALIARYSAMYQAKASEWEGYKAVVATETERIRALGIQSSTLLDSYKAATASVTAQAEMNAAIFRSNIAQYEAGQNIVLQTMKANNEAVLSTNAARLDAAKTGAQVYAQLAASAYNMAHAQASASSQAGMAINYSYSNDTTTAVAPKTEV